MVIIEWNHWECKEEARESIEEMVRIGLNCRINQMNDSAWENLSVQFGSFLEREVA